MKRTLACLVLALPVFPSLAHDLWLEPRPARAAPGETIEARLVLGGDGALETMPFDPARVERLWSQSARGARPLGLRQVSAAAVLEVNAPGTTSIGYVSRPALSELAPAAFATYLREEHLDRALARWQRSTVPSSAPSSPVREHFSRSLKALVGDGQAALVDCPLGLPLELSLLRSAPGSVLLRATFDGEPQAGLWVELTDAHGRVLAARSTDAQGQARFAAPQAAAVLRATHIQPSSRDDVAWRSWWASTTFTPTAAGVAACEADAATPLASR
jgi:hypothetical protein